MPGEPKRRHSRERKGERRSTIKFIAQQTTICPNCGSSIYPHQICKQCGFYRGKKIVELKKTKKKE